MTKSKPKKKASKEVVKIVTPEERAQLPVRKSPYWVKVGKRYFLGLYKGPSGMTWLARLTKPRSQGVIGVPEEEPTRGGTPVLSFSDAVGAAKEWCKLATRPRKAAVPADPTEKKEAIPADPTLGDALDRHLAVLESAQLEEKGTARTRYAKHKREVGHFKLRTLVAENLTDWLTETVETPPQRRPKKNGAPNYAKNWDPNDPVARRRRQSTANRALADVLASLNQAYENNWVDSDKGWRSVHPFRNCDGVRDTVLDAQQQSDLLNAADDEFRPIVYGGLLTGSRFGPLRRIKVKDFRPLDRAIKVGWDKRHDRERLAPLTDEAIAVFHHICKNRDPEECIFLRKNGKPWGTNHHQKFMDQATEDAGLDITFYGLRHTCATAWLLSGISESDVASALGTTVKMVHDHYKNPAIAKVAENINAKAPRIGSFASEIQAITEMYEQQRIQRIQDHKTLEFTLESLHPSSYRVDRPAPTPRPTYEELEALIEAMTLGEVGKKFGVSGITVAKWCRQVGLMPRGRGYWAQRKAEGQLKGEGKAKAAAAPVAHPTKAVLEKLIWEMPATDIGKKYGVSGPTVLRWAVKLGITCPGRGYWSKHAGKTHQKAKKAARLAARRKGKT